MTMKKARVGNNWNRYKDKVLPVCNGLQKGFMRYSFHKPYLVIRPKSYIIEANERKKFFTALFKKSVLDELEA